MFNTDKNCRSTPSIKAVGSMCRETRFNLKMKMNVNSAGGGEQ